MAEANAQAGVADRRLLANLCLRLQCLVWRMLYHALCGWGGVGLDGCLCVEGRGWECSCVGLDGCFCVGRGVGGAHVCGCGWVLVCVFVRV